MSSWREQIATALGQPVTSVTGLSGGSIAQAHLATLDDGRRLVVKTFAGRPDMFPEEARGLRELAAADAIRVPEVLAVGDDFLALEYLENGSRAPDFSADFGCRFAALHRHSADYYGFPADNYIGSTPQRNTPTVPAADGWTGFYWTYRLEYQLRLAESQGRAPADMIRMMTMLEDKLPALLDGSDEPPALLHGDLWSGNVMVGPDGHVAIIDPAAYYGHREADLGMTTLFGGFDRDFYAAYRDAWPLADGWQRREPVYQLYHLLNHLNIFGGGYLSQCMSALAAALRAA